MSELRELYQATILDHNRKPRNFREPEGASHRAEGHNPLCGDEVTVFSDGACKPSSSEPHFATTAASNEVTLVFQPPTGGTAPTVLPVARAWSIAA